MKMWISKYALTSGIEEKEGRVSALDQALFINNHVYHRIGKNAHETRAAAVEAAKRMQARKVASLKKQLARIESLTFEE